MQIDTERRTLTLGPEHGALIDLTSAVRAGLYDLSVLREMVVTDFEPRLVQPLADGVWVNAYRGEGTRKGVLRALGDLEPLSYRKEE